jgi:hypothetical protein
MASKTQDKLYETFLAISGGHASRPDPAIDARHEPAGSADDRAKVTSSTVNMGTVAAKPEPAGQPAPGAAPDSASGISLAQLISMAVPAASAAPASSDALPSVNDAGTNVRPPSTTTASTSQSTTSTLLESVLGSVPLAGTIAGAATGSSGGGGSTFDSIASTVLKSGFGLIPLIGGLLGLFGGGDSSTPALQKYTMPGTIGYEGADTGSGISAMDFDQMGMPRTYSDSSGGSSSGGTSSGSSSSGGTSSGSTSSGASSSGGAPAPQVTVSVQAMDARSFLDRSSDIAAAVRDAMLNLNSINDVVNELS